MTKKDNLGRIVDVAQMVEWALSHKSYAVRIPSPRYEFELY